MWVNFPYQIVSDEQQHFLKKKLKKKTVATHRHHRRRRRRHSTRSAPCERRLPSLSASGRAALQSTLVVHWSRVLTASLRIKYYNDIKMLLSPNIRSRLNNFVHSCSGVQAQFARIAFRLLVRSMYHSISYDTEHTTTMILLII